VVFSPELIKEVLSDATSRATKDLNIAVMRNVFGLELKEEETYGELQSELNAAVLPHLKITDGSQASSLDIVGALQGSLTDMVTFNASMVDQEPWERLSMVTVAADNDLAEASLL
jgi:hypothetical protein